LLVFAALLLVCAGVVSGLSVARAVNGERQREVAAAHAAAKEKLRRLIPQYRDLLWRHPDLPLAAQTASLAAFRALTLPRQSGELAEFEEGLERLRMSTARATGAWRTAIFSLVWKSFSPNGFKAFFDAHQYQGVTVPASPPPITSHEGADAVIRGMAEERGYRLRPLANPRRLVTVGGHLMQPQIAAAWEQLRLAAAEDAVSLAIISAYRSTDRQREIFLYRLARESRQALGHEITAAEIVDGRGRGVIDEILRTSSIPGYSKHHTGYTIDITDSHSGLSFLEFANTAGFLWISAHNYENAKRFGFIPSYPEGADSQGPEPEAWEYVWVGVEALTESPADE